MEYNIMTTLKEQSVIDDEGNIMNKTFKPWLQPNVVQRFYCSSEIVFQ